MIYGKGSTDWINDYKLLCLTNKDKSAISRVNADDRIMMNRGDSDICVEIAVAYHVCNYYGHKVHGHYKCQPTVQWC